MSLGKGGRLVVFAANTGLGKTIFSAGLCRALDVLERTVYYVKPIQTGYPETSDAEYSSFRIGPCDTC